MDGVEGLAEIDECQDTAEVVGSNTFKQTSEGYYLSNCGFLLSESVLWSSEQRIECGSQPVHDHAVVELHNQGDEADPSVVVRLSEVTFLGDCDYDKRLPSLRFL